MPLEVSKLININDNHKITDNYFIACELIELLGVNKVNYNLGQYLAITKHYTSNELKLIFAEYLNKNKMEISHKSFKDNLAAILFYKDSQQEIPLELIIDILGDSEKTLNKKTEKDLLVEKIFHQINLKINVIPAILKSSYRLNKTIINKAYQGTMNWFLNFFDQEDFINFALNKMDAEDHKQVFIYLFNDLPSEKDKYKSFLTNLFNLFKNLPHSNQVDHLPYYLFFQSVLKINQLEKIDSKNNNIFHYLLEQFTSNGSSNHELDLGLLLIDYHQYSHLLFKKNDNNLTPLEIIENDPNFKINLERKGFKSFYQYLSSLATKEEINHKVKKSPTNKNNKI